MTKVIFVAMTTTVVQACPRFLGVRKLIVQIFHEYVADSHDE